jgi:hypothetical protein
MPDEATYLIPTSLRTVWKDGVPYRLTIPGDGKNQRRNFGFRED